jgi:hypothetical protein
MNTKPETPAPQAPAHRQPIIGEDVHFFDEARGPNHSQGGAGPYAAKVVGFGFGGVALTVATMQGWFNVDRVLHKSRLDKTPGKKRWWNFPQETPKQQQKAAG